MLDHREVTARVDAMGEYVSAREWEAAHQYEWALWEAVLRAIAMGQISESRLAEAALQTLRYQYPRSW